MQFDRDHLHALPNLRRLSLLLSSLLVAACSPEGDTAEQAPEPSDPLSGPGAMRAADSRPSVVLIVVDTLRADAVSAHGRVEGTTPTMDALAESGIRYELAVAPAPYTASSHASLFTGLRVDEHGVGLSPNGIAQDSLQMLAEDFQQAGYATAGFSENSLLGPEFGFDQGFDRYEVADLIKVIRADMNGEDSANTLGLVERVRAFMRTRDRSRPYFLFINIIDPHDPYIVREVNRWVPDGTTPSELRLVKLRHRIPRAICDRLPPPADQAIFRGLYLGDVAAADRKLDRLLSVLDSSAEDEERLTVVTSDHGEHLGEHGLMGHRFSVRSPALRIPLIVAGLPDVTPATVETPVEMRSLRQSLLCWSLAESCPAELPLENGTAPEVANPPIFSIYSDIAAPTPEVHRTRLGFGDGQWIPDSSRSGCGPEDLVFGEMVSMIRYPMKVTWVEGQEILLHDLSWDPGERSNQLELQPKVADVLVPELQAFVKERLVDRSPAAPSGELSEETMRGLKSLGYID
jgi:hypothetical protein